MRARVLGAALAAALAWALPAAAAPEAAKNITLIDQTGTSFHLSDLKGQPSVISFVATRCKDTCPITEAVFSGLARQNIAARLVTITLDPDYDTPFVMARHARDLHARADRWQVASGRPSDIAHLLAGFGVVREYDRAGIPDAHSSFIYVFDARGRLAKTIPLSTNSLADIRRAVASESIAQGRS